MVEENCSFSENQRENMLFQLKLEKEECHFNVNQKKRVILVYGILKYSLYATLDFIVKMKNNRNSPFSMVLSESFI